MSLRSSGLRRCITKRVGGGVQDFDAIKLLKFAVNERGARRPGFPRRGRCRRRPLAQLSISGSGNLW
jgi:hypothetical protein